jgi:hypothetical protein
MKEGSAREPSATEVSSRELGHGNDMLLIVDGKHKIRKEHIEAALFPAAVTAGSPFVCGTKSKSCRQILALATRHPIGLLECR